MSPEIKPIKRSPVKREATEPRGIHNPTDRDYERMAYFQEKFRIHFNGSAGQDYMVKTRKHDPKVLDREGVGYLEVGLITQLNIKNAPMQLDELRRYGLVSSKGNDIACKGLISIPMKDRNGRICAFRFKDPAKTFKGQQLKHGVLNGVVFLGEHTLSGLRPDQRVCLVEGEDDWLSMLESGWEGGLLATCGQLSKAQVEWLAENLSEGQLVTLFDNDHAGDGYRQRVAESLASLNPVQYVPPKGDPDEFLKEGGTLEELMATRAPIKREKEESEVRPVVRINHAMLDLQDYNKVLSFIPPSENDPSDVSVARAYAKLSGGRLVFVKERKEWSFFDTRWYHDSHDVAVRQVVAIGDAFKQAAKVAKDADEAKSLKKVAKLVHMDRKIEAVLRVAANDQDLLVSASQFDANEGLIGVKNGVIELKATEFRAARPSDYLSKFCNVDYDANADCPTFKTFLKEAFRYEDEAESQEMLNYVQWAIGQLLLWKPGRRWIAHLYGPPGSGKSTLVETLKFVMGDYGTSVEPKSVAYSSKPSGSAATPDIAKLLGMRFVTVPEAGDENTLNDELLKALSGGDTISARFLNKNPIEFRFGGMIWFVGNTRPSSKTNGAAFFRRFRIIPMLNSRPETEQDRNLEERLRAEASGILNFALEGLRKFGTNEPTIPGPMLRELEVYKEEMDLMGLWILENCKTGDGVECSTTTLHEYYSKFMRNIGSLPLGRNKFQQRMIDRGFAKVRRGSIATLLDITIDFELPQNQK